MRNRRPAARPPDGRQLRHMEKIRISKLMAERGLCSRREADSYIERGWVTVDGVVVAELGARAFPDQVITLERAAQARPTARVTILINKSSEERREGKECVCTCKSRWAPSH